jgi:hypothetical protein
VTDVFKEIKAVLTFRLPLLSTSWYYCNTAVPLGKRNAKVCDRDNVVRLSVNQVEEAKKLHD